jgi:hypothetical protein
VETSAPPLCCNEGMEDYKPFKIVSVLQGAKTYNVDSVYDAAKYLLQKWPEDEHGPKYQNCKAIHLKCLADECSAAVARVAFVVEAAGKQGYTLRRWKDRRRPAS